ncbi:MAG: hypothetical protein BWY09_01335 [Candidatus Hydrogenedentes bacterium ADurb.Bin179]|nr:MAG: hypothetical protein BWY09_01335 [Candidatus Hydrogenedentes bacterium ADurb.Bin179]
MLSQTSPTRSDKSDASDRCQGADARVLYQSKENPHHSGSTPNKILDKFAILLHNILMWIERDIMSCLRRAWEQFPIVVLTGMRQAGKTSLVRRVFPDANYVSFDIPRDAEHARLDYEDFIASHSSPLIMDEIQYVPEIFRHLKYVVDRDRRPGLYVLTGSQDFLLMSGVAESLAGRCAVLSLSTLSLSELTSVGGVDTDAFCWRGGFPELWQRSELDRDLWYGSYVATYLERDVRNILNVSSLRDFDRFLRALALRAGRLLSYSDLARDVGITPNTAKNWISLLAASRQVFLLEPYHRNAGKRLVKTPKIYFTDPGLLVYLLGFQEWSAVVQNAAWGAVWENLVVSEVFKYFLNQGKRPPCWFWRTQQGDEMDLLIETGPQQFFAVECKTAARVESRDLKGFQALEKAYGEKSLQKGAVACRTKRSYPLSEGGRLKALPLNGRSGLLNWLP